jgi:hypothetical protein
VTPGRWHVAANANALERVILMVAEFEL